MLSERLPDSARKVEHPVNCLEWSPGCRAQINLKDHLRAMVERRQPKLFVKN